MLREAHVPPCAGTLPPVRAHMHHHAQCRARRTPPRPAPRLRPHMWPSSGSDWAARMRECALEGPGPMRKRCGICRRVGGREGGVRVGARGGVPIRLRLFPALFLLAQTAARVVNICPKHPVPCILHYPLSSPALPQARRSQPAAQQCLGWALRAPGDHGFAAVGAPAILNNPPRHATPHVAPTSSTPLGPLWASETDAGVSPGRRLLLAVIAASPLVEMPRAERVARAPSRLPRKCLEARVSAELIGGERSRSRSVAAKGGGRE